MKKKRLQRGREGGDNVLPIFKKTIEEEEECKV
jgi:hypothetical protein